MALENPAKSIDIVEEHNRKDFLFSQVRYMANAIHICIAAITFFIHNTINNLNFCFRRLLLMRIIQYSINLAAVSGHKAEKYSFYFNLHNAFNKKFNFFTYSCYCKLKKTDEYTFKNLQRDVQTSLPKGWTVGIKSRCRVIIGKWNKEYQSPKKLIIDMDMSVKVNTHYVV